MADADLSPTVRRKFDFTVNSAMAVKLWSRHYIREHERQIENEIRAGAGMSESQVCHALAWEPHYKVQWRGVTYRKIGYWIMARMVKAPKGWRERVKAIKRYEAKPGSVIVKVEAPTAGYQINYGLDR